MTGSTIASATLELSPTATYYVPGVTGVVQQARFNDINGDGIPEILVSDGTKVVLYSPSDDNFLFETTIDAPIANHAILYDDVNLDHIPDILVGYYYENGTFEIDTVCRVEVYDGAAGFTAAESLYFEADIDFSIGTQSPSSFVAFDCLDVNGDGYNELFLSFDRCLLAPLWVNHTQVTTGQTAMYDGFPDALEFSRSALLRGIEEIEINTGEKLLIGTRYDNFAFIPGDTRSRAWVELMSGSGDSLVSIGEPPLSLCSGDSAFLISMVELLCVGDIHPGSDDPDILVRYHWHQTCYEDGVLTFDDSNTGLRLYRLGAPDDIEILWSDLTPEITGNFYYSPYHPGHFFGAAGGVIYKMNGLDGGEASASELLDADTIIWCSGADLTEGDFVAVKNQTLTVYNLDISTDALDDNNSSNTPEHYTLGNAYPNPFNSSCVIDYSLSQRAQTTISVYNILGQQIATIVDGVKAAGSHSVSWDGTDRSGKIVASGIYLYRMTVGDSVDSKKLILMK